LFGGFDLGPGDEHEIECRHAAGNIDCSGAAQRAVDHDGAGGQHELQFAGHESHDPHGSVHTDCPHVQSIAGKDAGLFGEPER